jgi:hypothetical protein
MRSPYSIADWPDGCNKSLKKSAGSAAHWLLGASAAAARRPTALGGSFSAKESLHCAERWRRRRRIDVLNMCVSANGEFAGAAKEPRNLIALL